jgi:hypothetical protein
MLLNVGAMRRTHAAFVADAFSDAQVDAGLDHGRYGPMDQGAYNQHYQGRFDVHPWAAWNWKPYWGFSPAAALVHFHGPKPAQYEAHHAANGSRDNFLFTQYFDKCDEFDKASREVRGDAHGCGWYLKEYRDALRRALRF